MTDTQAPVTDTDFWTSVEVVWRHRRVLIGGLLLTALLLGAAFMLVQPTYKATSSVILLVPRTDATDEESPAGGNPYLGFGGALNVTGSLVARAMMSDVRAAQVADRGGVAAYTVTPSSDDAPVLTIEATADNAEDALATASAVEEEISIELDRQQSVAGAPRSSWITSAPLDVAERASEQEKSRVRAMVAILVLGFAATIAACFFAESLAQRRGRRRVPAHASQGEVARDHELDEALDVYGLDLYGPGWVNEYAEGEAGSYEALNDLEYADDLEYAEDAYTSAEILHDEPYVEDDADVLAADGDEEIEYEYEYEYEYIEVEEDGAAALVEPVPLPTFSFIEASRRLEGERPNARSEVLQAVRVSRLFMSDPEPNPEQDLEPEVEDGDTTIAIAVAGES